MIAQSKKAALRLSFIADIILQIIFYSKNPTMIYLCIISEISILVLGDIMSS